MTYDVEVGRRRDVPWRPVLLLMTVVLAVVVLVGWVVVSRTVKPAAAPPELAPPASVVGVSPSPGTSSMSPVQTGSDLNEGLAAPEGSKEAATRFVVAWLDRDPASRKAALSKVASPGLAEQLMLTDPENIPAAKTKGEPALGDASTYSVQFTQTLTTGITIRVYLVADPQAPYGWMASSVEQA